MFFRKVSLLSAGLIITTVFLMQAVSFTAESSETWEEKYKSEPYITLLRDIVVKINKDYSYTEITHVVEKIQHEGGKKRGEITLHYDKTFEEISDIEAHTIMPDGTKLRYEKLQDLNYPGSYGVYTDSRMKMLTMPSVVVGSVIDWKATTITKRPNIERNFYHSFRFTCSCPVKEARYTIIAPKGMKLNFKNLNNEIKPKIDRAGDEVIYTWQATNNDKDDEEEFMPSTEELHKKITVSTLDDWKQLSAWAWPMYQRNIKVSPAMRAKVKEITGDKKTIAEKIQAIIQYIRNEFRYVAMQIESHGYNPHPADEVFSNKYGDCKDQTLVAIALLSEIGVKAWPTLVSTTSDLNRKDLLPMPSYFDHAILSFELEGKRYFADVLLKGYRFTEIPFMLAGKGAFIVNDRGGEFTTIPFTDWAETARVLDGTILIGEDGTAVADVSYALSRSFSIWLRENLEVLSTEEKEKVLAGIERQVTMGGKSLKRDIENEDVPYSEISFTWKFENPTLVQRMGDMMLFGMSQLQRGALFSSPKRRYSIVFRHDSESESNFLYIIPEGYEIVNLPKKVALDTPFAAFTREYSAEGSKIRAREIFSYKRAHIPVEEHHAVQNFFDSLPLLTNDKVVIKKKAVATRN